MKTISVNVLQDAVLLHDLTVHESWPSTICTRNIPSMTIHEECFPVDIPHVDHCSYKGHFYTVKHFIFVEAVLDGWGQRRITITLPIKIVNPGWEAAIESVPLNIVHRKE